MVPVMSLWLPIALAAVIVFVASSIIHMVLPYHKGDVRTLPKQDDLASGTTSRAPCARSASRRATTCCRTATA